jgi:hypothetical protein
VRAPSAEPPADKAADEKKGPSTTKMVVGLGAAVGGVAAAAYAYEEYKKLQNEEGANCGPAPSISYDGITQSRPTNAQLSAYGNWCRCMGYSGSGSVNGGYGCVK